MDITVLIVVLGYFIVMTMLSLLGNKLRLDKYGVYITPLGFLFRIKRFNKMLAKLGEKGKKLWTFVFRIGIVPVGLICVLLLVLFVVNPFLLVFGSIAATGIQVIIPGVTVSWEQMLLLVVPIVLILVSHEIGHAVMAVREGVGIESAGIFLFGVLFGGFVELVEERMKKASFKSKLKILLNGSIINAVIALVFLILLLLTPVFNQIGYKETSGVLVTKIYEDTPADEAGIVKGDVITHFGSIKDNDNGIEYTRLNGTNDYLNYISNLTENQLIIILFLDEKNISLIPTRNNPITEQETDSYYLGISITNYFPPKGSLNPFIPYYWKTEVLYTINIGVIAVFMNMLPLKITDGDKILESYLENRGKKENEIKKLMRIIRICSLALIVSNILLSMLLL